MTEPAELDTQPDVYVYPESLRALYERFDDRDSVGPWQVLDLTTNERQALYRVLTQFVDDLNDHRAWQESHLIPPCWPAHAGLTHELVTLYWVYYEAFDTPTATAASAQVWHDRYLAGFYARMPQWISDECRRAEHVPGGRPARTQAEKFHEPSVRNKTLAAIETALVTAVRRPAPRPPVTTGVTDPADVEEEWT